jgi:hypothetical protein
MSPSGFISCVPPSAAWHTVSIGSGERSRHAGADSARSLERDPSARCSMSRHAPRSGGSAPRHCQTTVPVRVEPLSPRLRSIRRNHLRGWLTCPYMSRRSHALTPPTA